jgi:RimJ/RimL family protein N-acetyltransferase
MKNVFLRKLTREGLGGLLADLCAKVGTEPGVSIINAEELQVWFGQLDTHPTTPVELFMVAHCAANSSAVGIAQFNPIDWANRSCTLTWKVYNWFEEDNYSKSILRNAVNFAFDALNLLRINCSILPQSSDKVDLVASVESVGFVKEGVKREAILVGDCSCDLLCYGLLRKERKTF